MDLPQINIGKKPHEHMHVTMVLPLPAHTPFGNLNLKSLQLLYRLDWVNLQIERVFKTHASIHLDPTGRGVFEHLLYAEETIYWLRKTADELISLAFVLETRARTGKWPQDVLVDCIGALKNKEHPPPDTLKRGLEEFLPFLTTLNDVANAFKHSFINGDVGSLMGRDYPVVYTLELRKNRRRNEPILHSVTFSVIVLDFSRFYESIRLLLRAWASAIAESPNPEEDVSPPPISTIKVWK